MSQRGFCCTTTNIHILNWSILIEPLTQMMKCTLLYTAVVLHVWCHSKLSLGGRAGCVSVSLKTTGSLTPLQSRAAESPQGPNEDDQSQESSHCNPDDDGQAQRPWGEHNTVGIIRRAVTERGARASGSGAVCHSARHNEVVFRAPSIKS